MIAPYLRLLRPRDWLKSLVVLLPVAFVLPGLLREGGPGGAGTMPELTSVLLAAVAASVAFCLASSGFYAINDALDAELDRGHPRKRERPVAAGEVHARHALRLGLVLVAAGLVLGFAVNATLGTVLASYALLLAAYDVRLKRVLHVDVMVVGVGFALRAAGGAAAIAVPLSMWMFLCLFFLGLYLGFLKRLCDVASAEAGGVRRWRGHCGYDDRVELNWLLGLTAGLSVLTYLMYALSAHASILFGVRSRGFALLSPLVLIAIHRLYRRSSRGRSDSPLAAVFEDRAVRASVVLFAVGVLVTLYVPAAERLLGHLFVAGPEVAGGE